MVRSNEQSSFVRIVIAIESTDLRLAVELMLSEDPHLTFVGAVSNAEGLRGLVEMTHPDLIILQGDSQEFPIKEFCSVFSTLNLSPRIIYLGKDLDDQDVALEAGAAAFVLIGSMPEALKEAIWAHPKAESTEKTYHRKYEED